MNATEERLRDALKTVGDTIGPEDMPEPRLAAGRRRARRIAPAVVAVAACAAVVAGGAVVGGALSSGGTVRPLTSMSASPSTAPTTLVTVFLCTKASPNPSCLHEKATEPQKQALRQGLEALPGVSGVEYESDGQAYERLKRRFPDSELFRRSVEVGDVPDSFRVVVGTRAEASFVQRSVLGSPGVDTVIVEGR